MAWDTSTCTLYAVDNKPRFYVSNDKGCTWHTQGVRIPFEKRPNVSHVCSLASFVQDGRPAFYVTTSYSGEIFRTLDTGRNWQLVFSDSAFRNHEIPKLARLREGRLFACTATGIIDAPGSVLIGTEGGRRWKVVPAPEGQWSFDEETSRPGFLAAGGFSLGKNAGDAALFVTENYGRTWAGRQVLGAALVWKVEFVPPESWLLATDHGLLQLNIN